MQWSLLQNSVLYYKVGATELKMFQLRNELNTFRVSFSPDSSHNLEVRNRSDRTSFQWHSLIFIKATVLFRGGGGSFDKYALVDFEMEPNNFNSK